MDMDRGAGMTQHELTLATAVFRTGVSVAAEYDTLSITM